MLRSYAATSKATRNGYGCNVDGFRKVAATAVPVSFPPPPVCSVIASCDYYRDAKHRK